MPVGLNTAEAVDNVIVTVSSAEGSATGLNTAEAVDNVIYVYSLVVISVFCLNTAEAVDNVIFIVLDFKVNKKGSQYRRSSRQCNLILRS